MVSVSPLTVDDWRDFAAIRLEALKDNPGVFSSNYAKESAYGEPEWSDWLSRTGKCFFGAKDGGRLVGIMGIITHREEAKRDTGVIVSVFVRPEYRGKGLSGDLYRACIDWGKGYRPWDRIIVAHRADNDASRRAIQKQGFVVTHSEPMVWPDGTASDEIWYQMDLKPLREET